MRQIIRTSAICAALLAISASAAIAQSPALVTIKTPRGANQAFILIKPDKPVASVILFAGGHGGLGLKSATDMTWGKGNFLVRSREKFASLGLMVAVIDAPSDNQGGMKATFRFSSEHAADIGAVAAHLKKEANVPVWTVGTSMGTWSAATGAMGAKDVDGLVLTSTVTRAKPEWAIAKSHPNGVASLSLSRVKVPTLVMSHKNDGCAITPAADAAKLTKALSGSKKVEVILMEGGSPPESDPCEAKSEHGFLGIEGDAVAKIANFIKANGK
jgi:predicted dienelactone hydrolase